MVSRNGGTSFVPVLRTACVALLVGGIALACGDAEDANIKRNTAGSGGDAGDGPDAGGGTGATGNTGQGGAAEPEPPCEPGERGCDGNTPRQCNDRNEWVLEEKECGGDTKVCTGKGECVPYRLLNAGIDSFGVRPPEGAIVLKEQTLSAAIRSCGAVRNRQICVTGGVR